MSDPVRLGIIGCGKIANVDHIPGHLAAGCQVTALCDIRPERFGITKENHQEVAAAAEFGKDADLFASGLVDAVSICTPNDCHHPQTVAALQAGLHVLCDKPMAATLAQATEMVEASRAAGKVLQINQTLRYNAQYQCVVELVQGGTIGEPFHVRCLRGGDSTPNESWSPGSDWFVQKAHDGGVLLDHGIHMADLLRMVMGDAESVSGVVDRHRQDIDVADNVRALYRFRNGGTGVLELSWTMPGGGGLLEIYGTRGRIRMGFGDGIELWKDGVAKEEATTRPKPEPRDNSQLVFRDAVLGKRPSLTPGEYGRRALALCVAVQESSDSGQQVAIQHFDGEEGI